jgi:hypothetical protein
MLRPIRRTLIPGYAYTRNAYSSATGLAYVPGDAASIPDYFSQEEYLDDDNTDGHSWSEHSCAHLKITRRPWSVFLPPQPVAWLSPGNPAAGTWDSRAGDGIATSYLWNYWQQQNGVFTFQYEPIGTYGYWDTPTKGEPVLGRFDGSRLLMTPPANLDTMVSRALNAMAPGIKPANNVSLINSLIELKDFHSLPKTLGNIYNTGMPLVQRLLKGVATNNKLTLRKLLRTGSDSYLQTQFNILPLLSDIVAVKRAISDARQQLQRLLANANRPQKRHFRVSLADQYVNKWHQGSQAITLFWCVPNSMRWGRLVSYPVREFNATLSYSYSLPDWVNEDSLIQALLDRMGVNLNPRIIWNAIPWSFVVDWLIGVNQWLDNFRSRNIEPVVNIHGFSYSWHVRRVINTTVGFMSDDPCVEYVEDAYQRIVPLTASLYSSLVTSGLSPKEFSLAAALALTR